MNKVDPFQSQNFNQMAAMLQLFSILTPEQQKAYIASLSSQNMASSNPFITTTFQNNNPFSTFQSNSHQTQTSQQQIPYTQQQSTQQQFQQQQTVNQLGQNTLQSNLQTERKETSNKQTEKKETDEKTSQASSTKKSTTQQIEEQLNTDEAPLILELPKSSKTEGWVTFVSSVINSVTYKTLKADAQKKLVDDLEKAIATICSTSKMSKPKIDKSLSLEAQYSALKQALKEILTEKGVDLQQAFVHINAIYKPLQLSEKKQKAAVLKLALTNSFLKLGKFITEQFSANPNIQLVDRLQLLMTSLNNSLQTKDLELVKKILKKAKPLLKELKLSVDHTTPTTFAAIADAATTLQGSIEVAIKKRKTEYDTFLAALKKKLEDTCTSLQIPAPKEMETSTNIIGTMRALMEIATENITNSDRIATLYKEVVTSNKEQEKKTKEHRVRLADTSKEKSFVMRKGLQFYVVFDQIHKTDSREKLTAFWCSTSFEWGELARCWFTEVVPFVAEALGHHKNFLNVAPFRRCTGFEQTVYTEDLRTLKDNIARTLYRPLDQLLTLGSKYLNPELMSKTSDRISVEDTLQKYTNDYRTRFDFLAIAQNLLHAAYSVYHRLYSVRNLDPETATLLEELSKYTILADFTTNQVKFNLFDFSMGFSKKSNEEYQKLVGDRCKENNSTSATERYFTLVGSYVSECLELAKKEIPQQSKSLTEQLQIVFKSEIFLVIALMRDRALDVNVDTHAIDGLNNRLKALAAAKDSEKILKAAHDEKAGAKALSEVLQLFQSKENSEHMTGLIEKLVKLAQRTRDIEELSKESQSLKFKDKEALREHVAKQMKYEVDEDFLSDPIAEDRGPDEVVVTKKDEPKQWDASMACRSESCDKYVEKLEGCNSKEHKDIFKFGEIDFSMLRYRKLSIEQKESFASIGSSSTREIITIDATNSPLVNAVYKLFERACDGEKDLTIEKALIILNQILNEKVFAYNKPDSHERREEFIKNYKITHPNSTTKHQDKTIPVIPMDAFITEQNGACRHHSFLAWYLLNCLKLNRPNLFKGVAIQHIRDNARHGAHSWVNVVTEKGGWLFDSCWEVVQSYTITDTGKLPTSAYGYGPDAIRHMVEKSQYAIAWLKDQIKS